MDFVCHIYDMTDVLPNKEQYGLTTQMRRSAVSISSNLAEGSRRRSKKEFRQFIHIALGSAAELETQMDICNRLKFISNDLYQKRQSELEEILKMLGKLEFVLRTI